MPGPGVTSELQLQAYATATRHQTGGMFVTYAHGSQQRWILNPVSEASQTLCWVLNPPSHDGNAYIFTVLNFPIKEHDKSSCCSTVG